MEYVFEGVAKTGGAVILSVLGGQIGRWFAQRRNGTWLVGYVLPFLLVIGVGLPRRFPSLEEMFPFSVLMGGRTEFAVIALISTWLLATPCFRLRDRSQRRSIVLLMVVFALCFSVLPLLVPALMYPSHTKMKTYLSHDGVCIQSTDYSCGPAAAVTLLREKGINAEEGELVIGAFTSPYGGTTPDALRDSMMKIYGFDSRIVTYEAVDELKEIGPFISLVKYSFLVDHYVTVLEINEEFLSTADPMFWKQKWSHQKYRERSRGRALIVSDPSLISAQ